MSPSRLFPKPLQVIRRQLGKAVTVKRLVSFDTNWNH
jgi:hypothetical protein